MPNGRPPKYKTATEIHDAIVKYFQYCKAEREMPNKAGLCVSLVISDGIHTANIARSFPTHTVGADDLIENAWVQRLVGLNATGAIFYLKNYLAQTLEIVPRRTSHPQSSVQHNNHRKEMSAKASLVALVFITRLLSQEREGPRVLRDTPWQHGVSGSRDIDLIAVPWIEDVQR